MKSGMAIGLAAAAAFMLASLPVAYADEAQELATAGQHAGMSAGSTDIKMVHTHLHHVINCLVGEGGDGYDAAEANPCKGQGKGGIPDAAADKRANLEAAVAKAKECVAATDCDTARKLASETQALITKN
jgi:hypothetical protein